MKKEKNTISKEELSKLFPIKPYEIQLSLAKSIYQSIQSNQSKVMMVESPTGTGKTYSLLVGTLKWLIDHPHELPHQNQSSEDSTSIPVWLPKVSISKGKSLYDKKIKKIQSLQPISKFKQSYSLKKEKAVSFDNENFQVQSDLDDENVSKVTKGRNAFLQSEACLQTECLPKIIFASRTHSQLSQVIQSFNKMNLDLHCVSLASKDHLCVNSTLGKSNLHEKCQYLLSHSGCSFYHKNQLTDFFNLTVEESKEIGKKNNLCPYYGLKNIAGVADILCIPYASILNADIRQKLNIEINNSIIIFDEAHNLLEQDANLKSTQLSYNQIVQLCRRIDEYKQKYGKKVVKTNLFTINHLHQICKTVMSTLRNIFQTSIQEEEDYIKLTKINFFLKLSISQIQFYKIKKYIQLTNFDQKLTYFSKEPFSSSILNKFLHFLHFLLTVDQSQSSTDKKLQKNIILIKNLQTKNNKANLNSVSVKAYCLEGTSLVDIAEKAKFIILAGGTMTPITSYTSLFNLHNIKWTFQTFDHVIKADQCKLYCIPALKDNKILKFNYNEWKKDEKILLQSSLSIIENIVKKTQRNSGTAIFIQNYQVLQQIKKYFTDSIKGNQVFYDSQNSQSSVFQQYKDKITNEKQSAIIVSVMGGKLSEGINFSDNLVRSLIVLGLPYPSIKSAEIREKMSYLNQKNEKVNQKQRVFGYFGKSYPKENEIVFETGQQYYQNYCLKLINQTIGRGIRHRQDYAHIYLIDCRFDQIVQKLSPWLRNRIYRVNNFVDHVFQ